MKKFKHTPIPADRPMTIEEQLEHWVETRGRCGRPGSHCNRELCINKKTFGSCQGAERIFRWSIEELRRLKGHCKSIW
jgi:hypothetical protein